MGPLPPMPLKGLMIMAVIGVAACIIAALGTIGFLIWFVVNHVQIV